MFLVDLLVVEVAVLINCSWELGLSLLRRRGLLLNWRKLLLDGFEVEVKRFLREVCWLSTDVGVFAEFS
jgi:hypothetical protein